MLATEDMMYMRRREDTNSVSSKWSMVATFTPLVLSTSGGWDLSAMIAFKRLAVFISEKYNQPYSSTLSFIRCKIAFSWIDTAIACLRGPRFAFHAPARGFNLMDHPLDLIRAEVHHQA